MTRAFYIIIIQSVGSPPPDVRFLWRNDDAGPSPCIPSAATQGSDICVTASSRVLDIVDHVGARAGE